MSYLVDKRPRAYRNPREKSISYPHDILFKKIIFYGFAYLILVSSQANSEKIHPPPKKKIEQKNLYIHAIT